MSSSSSPRETIQISLGPSANAITAHLLNLQGLAATSASGSKNNNVYCDPTTTHHVQGRGSGTLVPRVLIVDEANHQVPATSMIEQGVAPQQHGSMHQTFWDGNVQVLGDDALSATTTAAWNNGRHNVVDASRITSPFWQTASSLAYSPYSRYHCTQDDNDRPAHQYRANPDNSRHVVWDNDDVEEEEEDPFERALRQDREEQSERRWKTETAPVLGQELDRQIAEKMQQDDGEGSPPQESSSSSWATEGFGFNHWTDIWMPPKNPKSKVVLPFSSQSQLVPHWNVSYQNDGSNSSSTTPFLQEWKEDVLFENVRHMLEECDYGIQGVSISTEGHGIYVSLATSLLDELKQECKSAGRLVYHLRNNEKKNVDADESPSSASPSSWQEAKVDQIRKHISSGLALHDFTEKAHAVLPLRLSGDSRSSFFRDTAQIAMALEASTLPFRLNGKNSNTTAGIGLQNAPFMADGASDTPWGSTATRLTFSEYLQVLQPSSAYSMLELDIISQIKGNVNGSISNERLFESIQEGTSVERDQRTRQSRGNSYRTRPQESSPGSWMRDARDDSTSGTKGLLSSLSYCTSLKSSADRSVHHHFSLSTSVRPTLSSPSLGSGEGNSMSDYMTCLVQGMGIQYRPERSMATVLNQSLGQMTFGSKGGGGNYGAGIYWKYIIPQVDTPVVAVLGNSTRAFASLNEISTDMKVAMKSPRFRGFYNRDVSNGVLPELEDCDEALEACWNKRDVYQPPSGSGFGSDEDY